MPWRERTFSVPTMNASPPLRLGACAAVAGPTAQLAAIVLEPDWGGDEGEAVRVVSGSGIWIADRVLDLVGVLLTVVALTVAAARFPEPRANGRELECPFSPSWLRSLPVPSVPVRS